MKLSFLLMIKVGAILSITGSQNLPTPYIDSLAHDGASFEKLYVYQVFPQFGQGL
ncbi:MAG: hypothetical protein P8N49_08575 [Opitutales bacterium]|nr:hypothetical protein [Opitutales bacterium]